MNYAIEEAVVDCMVAYLGRYVSSAMIRAAPSIEVMQYPAVAVYVAGMSPIRPALSWSDSLRVDLEIAAMTQSQDELDSGGNVLRTARMRNADLRQSVLTALTVKDSEATPTGVSGLCDPQDLPTGLAARLCAERTPGVWVKGVQPGTPLVRMEANDELRLFISVIRLDVIAQATEIV
jgi:hypothetical protein